MVNRERKMVKDYDWLYLEGMSISEAIEHLYELKDYYSSLEKVIIDYQYSGDDDDRLYIVREIPETDEQMKTRIESEEYYEKQREEYEKKEFERLKRKFK
jgi:hypothetical protein